MARPVRVMSAPPTVKVMPPVELKPRPHDEDHRGDDQVAGLGQVHLVLHHVAHAHGGDHAVQHEADAAHDGGGDGVDQGVKLGGEGEDDGVHGGQADDPGIVDLAQSQNAGILAVGGVGGAAEHTGQRGGQAVAQEGAVQAGVCDEVRAGGGGDGGHIADVLHHGGDGDGSHDQDGGQVKLGDDELLQAHKVAALCRRSQQGPSPVTVQPWRRRRWR